MNDFSRNHNRPFLSQSLTVGLLTAAFSLLLYTGLPVAPGARADQPKQDTRKTDEEAINNQINKYLGSVDAADTNLAAEVWATTPDVSFIHPRGHERGWEQVKKSFYENTMAAPFSERRLKVVGDVNVHVLGDAAWAEFYWDFVAKFKNDGKQLNTKGRETQVFRKEGGNWRLVHVHYSGMPVEGDRSGF